MNKVNEQIITQSMLDRALDKQSKSIVDDIASIINDFSTQVDERFDMLESRMSARFEKIEKAFADLQASHDRLTNTIDGFVKRIDDYEQENLARDRHIARLETWIQQVAKETGVNLKESL